TDCMTSVAACRGTQELGAQHHALASAYLRRESADEMIRPGLLTPTSGKLGLRCSCASTDQMTLPRRSRRQLSSWLRGAPWCSPFGSRLRHGSLTTRPLFSALRCRSFFPESLALTRSPPSWQRRRSSREWRSQVAPGLQPGDRWHTARRGGRSAKSL